MQIRKIIDKYYNNLHSLLPSTDIEIYNGYTYEDILNNVIITAINKWKNVEIDEETGYNYVRKTLLTEILFAKKRKGKDRLLFAENLNIYDRATEM